MPVIKHKQTGKEQSVSWHVWTTHEQYKDTKHLWDIIDFGDPVNLFHRPNVNQEFTHFGVFDRVHAQNMINSNHSLYFLEDLNKRETTDSKTTDQQAPKANANTKIFGFWHKISYDNKVILIVMIGIAIITIIATMYFN